MGEQNRHDRLRKLQRNGLIFLVFLLILSATFIPLPVYITQPGSVVDLSPIVQVEGGDRGDQGKFMLTTIRMVPGTIGSYLYAVFLPYTETIPREQIHSPHESDEQYTKRQLEVMNSSQETAAIVAFQKAGYDVTVKNQGVKVMMVVGGMPAENSLEIGDVIIEVDGRDIKTPDQLIDYLNKKRAGDRVAFTILRDEQRLEKTIELAPLKEENEAGEMVESERAGIGIYPVVNRYVELPREVEIDTHKIGGPSAGLMFTLAILNQLLEEDLTKGYKIAGTGTISEDGKVGPIGGVEQKIVAAHKADTEIFFVPSVKTGGVPSNYERALETAKELETSMKIVPVETVDDAIEYLKKLPPR